MKKYILPFCTLLGLASHYNLYAQWYTSGSNIYNSNSGNVGVGISSPDRKFYVRGAYGSSPALSAFEMTSGSESVAASFYAYPGNVTNNTYLKNTFMMYLGGTTSLHMNFANPKSGGTIRFHTGGFQYASTERMIIAANGYVGIGTSSPSYKLDVNGSINATGLYVNGTPFMGGGGSQSLIDINSGDGNGLRFWSSTSYKIHMGNSAEYHYGPVTDYSIKMNMSNTSGRGWTWGVAGATPIAALNKDGNMKIAGTIEASAFLVNGVPIGSGSSPWSINGSDIYYNSSGKVGIGTPLTTNPNNYKLAVNGTIGSKEVKVETSSATWPDYVFKDDYQLSSIEQVEEFMKENRHLPGVPTAKDINENGQALGEMNTVLLKKIEELTLYVIELKKEINQLKKKN